MGWLKKIIYASILFTIFCGVSFAFACLAHGAPTHSSIEGMAGLFMAVSAIIAIGGPIGILFHDC